MNAQSDVDSFLAERSVAVVGVSRGGQKFGNAVYRELRKKGYSVYAVNPHAETVEGDPCYPSLSAVPDAVGAAVVVVPPAETEQVVKEAVERGIRKVWLQQGAESRQALDFCKENGITAISDECILMFAPPVGFPHRAHRFIWKLLGKLPK